MEEYADPTMEGAEITGAFELFYSTDDAREEGMSILFDDHELYEFTCRKMLELYTEHNVVVLGDVFKRLCWLREEMYKEVYDFLELTENEFNALFRHGDDNISTVRAERCFNNLQERFGFERDELVGEYLYSKGYITNDDAMFIDGEFNWDWRDA